MADHESKDTAPRRRLLSELESIKELLAADAPAPAPAAAQPAAREAALFDLRHIFDDQGAACDEEQLLAFALPYFSLAVADQPARADPAGAERAALTEPLLRAALARIETALRKHLDTLDLETLRGRHRAR